MKTFFPFKHVLLVECIRPCIELQELPGTWYTIPCILTIDGISLVYLPYGTTKGTISYM